MALSGSFFGHAMWAAVAVAVAVAAVGAGLVEARVPFCCRWQLLGAGERIPAHGLFVKINLFFMG